MKNDPIAAACEIIADKVNPKRHKCPPPRPWWLPARFAKCTCLILHDVGVLNGHPQVTEIDGKRAVSLDVIAVAEARVQTECCRRHGSAK